MQTTKLFLLSAVIFSGAAFGTELYVSPSGNDKNSGSSGSPFATIGKAAERAKPGDTVKIGPGIYREQITFRKGGKPDAPIIFEGTRGRKGEFLTVVEAPGMVLDKWAPAPEIHPDAWKTRLAKRPDLIMMDGAMIAYINRLTMALPGGRNRSRRRSTRTRSGAGSAPAAAVCPGWISSASPPTSR